jgi:hypothetical protein
MIFTSEKLFKKLFKKIKIILKTFLKNIFYHNFVSPGRLSFGVEGVNCDILP